MAMDVSRETSEAIERLFPDSRVSLIHTYAELLATEGVVRGLIGPREAPRLWERHLLPSAALTEAVPEDATVADVGSGAGLPGLVLAIARPDAQVTLIEPLLRRTRFLSEVIESLGVENAEVVRERAEALQGSRDFDVVTSRAVAPLPRLLGWCMPLVRPGGAMVALKGESILAEIVESAPVLDRWGCATPEVRTLGAGIPGAEVTVVRVAWRASAEVGLGARPPRTSRAGRSRGRKRRS